MKWLIALLIVSIFALAALAETPVLAKMPAIDIVVNPEEKKCGFIYVSDKDSLKDYPGWVYWDDLEESKVLPSWKVCAERNYTNVGWLEPLSPPPKPSMIERFFSTAQEIFQSIKHFIVTR